MLRRSSIATSAAVFAAAVALTPGLAYAAAPAHSAAVPAIGHVVARTPKPATPHTFSSPASKSIREQRPALASAKSAAGIAAATATEATGASSADTQATTPTVIYATTGPVACAPDNGTGTAAAPYCSVQDAVNAAAPGDTIDVQGSTGYFSNSPVTVTTSDISIVGIGGQAWIDTNGAKPALTLDGVTGVTVSNMMLTSNGSPTVDVVGSSDITLDSSYVIQAYGSSTPVNSIAIDGASSNVTVSRSYVDDGGGEGGFDSVAIASGASGIVLASDVLSDSGIIATGVNGLDVTGDTIQRGCASGIDIEGASTGVSLENNLLEDATETTDGLGGYPASCSSGSWAPDVTVSADAGAGTTADYNDFYAGSDSTDPYSWAGTAYATLGAFRSGAAQGAHDTADSVATTGVTFRANQWSRVDALLQPGSAAIGSANPKAPGALSTDFYGTSPYTSRGALQYLSLDPTLAVGVTGDTPTAYGVSLDAKAQSTAGLNLTVTVSWGDGLSSQSSATGGQIVPFTHEYKKLGLYNITVTVSDPDGNVVANSAQAETAGSDYVAYGPTRILDTRYATKTAPAAKVPKYGTVRVSVVGGKIPATATAAILNVTVTNPTAAGFITAYPDGSSRPTTSNVNFAPKQTVPNEVIVPIGADGKIALYNGSPGTVDLIADISGYFNSAPGSGYTSLSPYRIVDTRNGTGPQKGAVGKDGSFAPQIAGNDHGKLPSSGISAVALNVTSVGSKSAGYLTVYPDGSARPTTSNVSFNKGQTIANAVVVPVGSDGKIRIYNGSWGSSNVVVDVVGYYSAASHSAYMPLAPSRYLDTRSKAWGQGPLPSEFYIPLPLTVGSPDITSVVLNTTVTDTKGLGYLAVTPDPNTEAAYDGNYETLPPQPTTSALNWLRGQTVPNLVQATTTSTGMVDFWNNSTGSLDLLVDELGYYQND